MAKSELNILILAAGQGTRMRSRLPKVLHPLAGRPMLQHVIETARELRPHGLGVIYGHGGEQVPQQIGDESIEWILQAEQLGTGHAVMQALPQVADEQIVLVLYGDVPLLEADTLAMLVEHADQALCLLTVHLPDPTGYGRIVRDEHGRVTAIVEHKDATDEQRRITEVNTGILAVNGGRLKKWLGRLDNNNAQGEYYLTDIIAMAVADGVPIEVSHPAEVSEVLGVNSRQQLAALEREYQLRQATRLMSEGVSLADPARLDIRGRLHCGQDVALDINLVVEGEVSLADNVTVGPNCVLKDCTLEDGVQVLPMSVIEGAHIGAGSRIGPFARIRPGTELAGQTHIGNFVELKNSQVGEGSKINHLSYVGDTIIGKQSNIGAGVITCNYDGANKHRTEIGDNAFVGSDVQLVAPVKVGDGATIGAGTTLTSDAPENALTLSRTKQKTVTGWKRPTKQGRGTRDE
ncbi:bifunctional UDP-N-acetylglucosamine diphosphorylase/glucosamine-1-phosphate N-acetyltransferase GlmU [Thiohalophilus sp.]|uniref:bifunctional UDP-N-acetylglucosamine diphosphorylase/glucosamine-1-phosphate N-acetyltransferase GlmU n=1 Tax=Thiohalophilus sp. TaxID=3028392 RepID=UPI002ACE85CF|nr:bifunctional UDP-N-acetylglucosamine diphosphorylase/glucosamine-1-phosphate N-acetyltransferase GlmU [Thiohalophilus sp.]MDZ7803301.1 bifunctional UDP-N-acetylglucosamine diphosphorylase/glucosamine-1-phosphate N-acetyltransferase GlmU [Thiohalophilus sp.]